MTKAHAKLRPPSAASRWLSCPASVHAVQLYPNDESDASLKGDYAHEVLENAILFGVEPRTEHEDINEAVEGVLEWVRSVRNSYGVPCSIYAEQVFEIPETGEWGTCDITFVSPRVLHIADYKNGYVPVDHTRNAQMMTYLLGAIAKYGERKEYYVTVLQPNYNHIEGPYRTYQVTESDLEWFRGEIRYAMKYEKEFVAGKHCKKSYCPHRGACATFLEWAKTEAADAWFPADLNAITDDELAAALDHAEIIQGIRDELRKEAMRRITQMDRNVAGYKIVKSKTNRIFKNADKVKGVLSELGATDDDMYTKSFASPKGIEDFIKAYARKANLGRGAWKKIWENNIADHVLESASGLTLEKAIDGRPAHKKGAEFSALEI